MTLEQFLDEHGVLVQAFQPLKQVLNNQADALWKTHHQFSPWTIRSGKGGSPEFDRYQDTCLYRHCMDVATIAALLFFYSWQARQLGIEPEDQKAAESLLKQLIAVAFLHDADKYYDLPKPTTPEALEGAVKALYTELQIADWALVDAECAWALVSLVEHRTANNYLLADADLTRTQITLGEMVQIGDMLASKGSQNINLLIEEYNRRLKNLQHNYAVPQTKLKLLHFHQSPVILYYLQYAFLEYYYQYEIFPLICLLKGTELWVSIPEDHDIHSVFEHLYAALSDSQPRFKFQKNSGEINLINVFNPEDLFKAVERDKNNSLPLRVHRRDWEQIYDYIGRWAGQVGVSQEAQGSQQLLKTVQGESQRYLYALSIAVALRADTDNKGFQKRIQQLAHLNLPAGEFEKNTRQTLYAMEAAMQVHDETDLYQLLASIYGDFPQPQEQDEALLAIIQTLKQQVGLATATPEAIATAETSCLLCGQPTRRKLSQSMELAGVKSSAFNNRIGHRKDLWKQQTPENYLCECCEKQQALLYKLQPLRAEPLIIAIPFPGLIKPVATDILNSFTAVAFKTEAWKQLLPWRLDTSETLPFVIEENQKKFEETLKAVHRWVHFALRTGQPVHIFISHQRAVKTAFLFEPIPPLLKKLLKEYRYEGIYRQDLEKVKQRLDLLLEVLNQTGYAALTAIPHYGWWAIAWSLDRLDRNDLSTELKRHKIKIAQELYPMSEDSLIEPLAQFAAQMQRCPKSHNDEVFCLSIALEVYEVGRRKKYPTADTQAAISNTLFDRLTRGKGRLTASKGKPPLHQRCDQFAQAVIEFLNHKTEQGKLDSEHKRFLLSAYGNFFAQHCEKYQPDADEEQQLIEEVN